MPDAQERGNAAPHIRELVDRQLSVASVAFCSGPECQPNAQLQTLQCQNRDINGPKVVYIASGWVSCIHESATTQEWDEQIGSYGKIKP
jgi:hypothetical protein